MIEKAKDGEFNPFYNTYVTKVPDGDVLTFLQQQAEEIPDWLRSIADKADFRYEPGKWTLAEVLHHCNDTERIFAYRALCIARGDKAPLPGMDQNDYMAEARTRERSFESLVNEFESVRSATMSLVSSLSPEVMMNEGTASDSPVTVRALVSIMAGHLAHHVQVIEERYL
jgi:hypothetical protein